MLFLQSLQSAATRDPRGLIVIVQELYTNGLYLLFMHKGSSGLVVDVFSGVTLTVTLWLVRGTRARRDLQNRYSSQPGSICVGFAMFLRRDGQGGYYTRGGSQAYAIGTSIHLYFLQRREGQDFHPRGRTSRGRRRTEEGGSPQRGEEGGDILCSSSQARVVENAESSYQ